MTNANGGSSRVRRQGARLHLASLLAAVALVLVPMVWMFLASLQKRADLYDKPPHVIPRTIELQNYWRATHDVPFWRFLVNSIATTTIATAIKVVLGVLTAYALVFLSFPGRRLAFWFVVASLMVPFEVTLVPNYVTVAHLGWLNSWAGIVVPGAGVAFGAFLLHQSFGTIPKEIIEAAHIDGVGRWGLLLRVVLPMSRPAVSAFALITLVAKWNEYLWPTLVASTATSKTLPVGLTLLQNSEGLNEWGVIMAGTVLVVLPMLLLAARAQRSLVGGLVTGAVKG